MAVELSYAATAETRRRWDQRYNTGEQPWDTQITPPEVVEFWASGRLPADGVALDLGCGPGTNVRYLARRGLHAIGVEIAAPALLRARIRLQTEEPQLIERATFVCSDVCLLPFTGINASYILDVGCLHSLPPALRPYYAAGVMSNLAPGGFYQLYAFDAPTAAGVAASDPTGLAPGEVSRLFSPALAVVEEVIAKPERRSCRWYLLQRPLPV